MVPVSEPWFPCWVLRDNILHMEQSEKKRIYIGAPVTLEERDRLKKAAKSADLSVAQIIRRAIRMYLDQVEA